MFLYIYFLYTLPISYPYGPTECDCKTAVV